MGSDLCEIDVKRGIFQGDSLSPLIFVVCMIPLSLLLKAVKAYEWGGNEFKRRHLCLPISICRLWSLHRNLDHLFCVWIKPVLG